MWLAVVLLGVGALLLVPVNERRRTEATLPAVVDPEAIQG
jgi:hypothetical protein